ncbi:MAG: HAMP domain-containing protein [Bacteroidales bacterium]|nr:HAMP domain-containing protein [Bacteroidales bacterium]
MLLIFFVGRLVNPLKELRDIAKEVSEGNLKVRADIRQNDEIGTLGQAINQMVYKLREIVENIQIISYFSIEERQNSGFQTTSKSSVNAGSGNGNHSSSSTREYENNTYSAGNQEKEYTENGAGMKTKQSNNGQ